MTIDEAQQQLAALITPTLNKATADETSNTEVIPVADSLGRVVAEDTFSPVAVPAFANSAMDGYAVRHADLNSDQATTLTLQGRSLAGHPFTDALLPEHAVRVFTGAALPTNTDTVIIQENCEVDNAEESRVRINQTPAKGAYVRPIGHDVSQGSLLVAKGTRMRAFDIASATTSGLSQLDVFKPLRIGVFATGDELKTPGQPLGPGEIYESNRIAIISLLQGLPLIINDLGILPDDPLATRKALAEAADAHDALITSGGVSVGDADYVRSTIAELGAIDFWKLNLRPGKPFAFGHLNKTSGDNCLIFGLPGNPVSTIVTLLLLVKPALWTMSGATGQALQYLRAPLAQPVSHSVGRHEYQRGQLQTIDNELMVTKTSDQSSNRLQSFSSANCLFLVPGEVAEIGTGELVDVLVFDGLTN